MRFFQWDLMGILTSVLCTLHCVALPLAISSFSFWGTALLHNIWLEVGLIALAFLFGLMSFYKDSPVAAKRKRPLLLFCTGFGLLLANQWNEDYTLLLMPPASMAIIAAHVINYRYGKKEKARTLATKA